MMIEIKKPELETLIQERLQSGKFANGDELLTRAFHALDEQQHPLPEARQNLADFLLNSPFAGAELDLERRREFLRSNDSD